MFSTLAPLLDRINARRMRELLLDFADIASPPQQTAIAAEWYAGCLRAAGAAEVRILRDWPHAPSVVAGFPGMRRAPILEISGHLDAIPIGPPRAYCTGTTIVGRGIVSGKAELIAAAEAARVLASSGPLPGGGLLIAAHSHHEFPDCDDRDLALHIEQGIVGDAVVVAGGDHQVAPVASLGLGIFRAVFSPRRAPGHERTWALDEMSSSNAQDKARYTAIDAAQAFVSLLHRRQAVLARQPDPLIGAESLFVSGISGGDRYDRLPANCTVAGNWRWLPERHASDVFRELEAMARQAAHLRDARVDLTLIPRRDGFRLDPQGPVVEALRHAYQMVHDRPLPLGASTYATDAAVFVHKAGVEAVCHGVDTSTLRTDHESVTIDELVRVTRTYLYLIVQYLTRTAGNNARTPVSTHSVKEHQPHHDYLVGSMNRDREPASYAYSDAVAAGLPVEVDR